MIINKNVAFYFWWHTYQILTIMNFCNVLMWTSCFVTCELEIVLSCPQCRTWKKQMLETVNKTYCLIVSLLCSSTSRSQTTYLGRRTTTLTVSIRSPDSNWHNSDNTARDLSQGTARCRSSCHGPPTMRPCVFRPAWIALVADQAEDRVQAVPARPQVTNWSFTSIHKWPANVCCQRTWTTRPPNVEPLRFHRSTDKSEVRRPGILCRRSASVK